MTSTWKASLSPFGRIGRKTFLIGFVVLTLISAGVNLIGVVWPELGWLTLIWLMPWIYFCFNLFARRGHDFGWPILAVAGFLIAATIFWMLIYEATPVLIGWRRTGVSLMEVAWPVYIRKVMEFRNITAGYAYGLLTTVLLLAIRKGRGLNRFGPATA